MREFSKSTNKDVAERILYKCESVIAVTPVGDFCAMVVRGSTRSIQEKQQTIIVGWYDKICNLVAGPRERKRENVTCACAFAQEAKKHAGHRSFYCRRGNGWSKVGLQSDGVGRDGAGGVARRRYRALTGGVRFGSNYAARKETREIAASVEIRE